MKVIITQSEAIDKGIWPQVMQWFGIGNEDDTWPTEEFILTEEQAREAGLLK
ncbi:hypothetical protein [Paenibacillus physcomitrellae]|uniref:Uncharacterized protein n=1 Tax=Paenibacillus physcomitrellae TaxID=1619311 RepID=A0ABQ1FV06_9BACL|nr:hypothetical protein [Paenibacillus physcomitrellae]GGA30619.1 hypothetical protein GCM10010917_14590 [Paenibacillus physcomitrellae]